MWGYPKQDLGVDNRMEKDMAYRDSRFRVWGYPKQDLGVDNRMEKDMSYRDSGCAHLGRHVINNLGAVGLTVEVMKGVGCRV